MKNNTLTYLGYFFVAGAFFGFFNAAYVAMVRFQGGMPPCLLTSGCDAVLTSSYASMFGVPLAAIGAVYYAAMFFLGVWYLDAGKHLTLTFMGWGSAAGFLASFYFMYLQSFVIHAYCTYCLFSAAVGTTLFITAVSMVRLRKI